MSFIGWILLIAGSILGGLVFTGKAPDALLGLGWPFWAWGALAAVGLVLIVLNRRPAD